MELSGDDAIGSGGRKRKRHVEPSLEYPCVSRLRHRRLLSFLSIHDLGATFDALAEETDVLFRVEQLQRLVRQGRWADGIRYVWRFVPSRHLLGDAGRVFVDFTHIHEAIDSIVTGNQYGANVAARYDRHIKDYPNSYPGIVKIARILLTILRSLPLRCVLDWHLVNLKAAEIVKELVDQTPEFNDLLKLPSCPAKPHNILPIGPCFHRRRHVKNEGRIPASDIARFYLHKKRGLPSSNLGQETSYPVSGLSCEAAAWLADIIDESVQAGMLHDGYRLKYSCNEGVTGAPVLQAAKNYGISSETTAAMMCPLIITATGHQGFTARNNPTKPEKTAHQEINPTSQQITGEFVQDTSSIFQEYYSGGRKSENDWK
ncbi:uncharacterized protein LOC127772274 [Oryza glaberrima]|uniref:uncharacterized protein LOC127772274 n=1 Tax=Oryza glaberrima TaxID=4538 RepID=UPI00224C6131|nr:uncharacterized protein LOC127772274 [Oryza glaberrima]